MSLSEAAVRVVAERLHHLESIRQDERGHQGVEDGA